MQNNLTLKEKIGQMLMIGINDKDITNVINMIKEYKIGGVILYKKNYTSYEEMINVINKLKNANTNNKLPLFIAIDQEGGLVNRFPNDIVNIKNISDVSNKDDIDLVLEHANIISNILLNSGINMNLSPVLDIYNNNKFLNKRCFGNSKEKVIKYGIPYIKELQKNNIISVIKHYPGHGITKKDTHILTPYVFNYKKVLNNHIIPFKKAIEENIDAIMISHIVIRKLSGFLPCSISKKFIKTYLREKYNYNGLIITDDLKMKSIDLIYKKISLKKAFSSGADIILLKYKSNIEKELNKLINNIDKSTLINIDACVNRIINIKEKYNVNDKKITYNNLNIDRFNEEITIFNLKI